MKSKDGKIEYVPQKHDWGCGAAALAMVLGKSYDEVYEELRPRIEDKHGIHELTIAALLINAGYVWQMRYKTILDGRAEAVERLWPPEPFAPVHIVQVFATKSYHFVVMDSVGDILDPWREERRTLDHPDYKTIGWIMGLWKIQS